MTTRVQLSEVATILRGRSRARDVTEDANGEPEMYGIVLEADGLEDGLSKAGVPEPGYRPVRLDDGDVILVLRPSSVETLLVDLNPAGAAAGRGCTVVRLFDDQGLISPGYLAAWLQSPDFRRQADVRSIGGSLPRLSPADLRSFTIPVLSRRRQVEVAELSLSFSVALGALSRSLNSLEGLWSVELELAMLDEPDA